MPRLSTFGDRAFPDGPDQTDEPMPMHPEFTGYCTISVSVFNFQGVPYLE